MKELRKRLSKGVNQVIVVSLLVAISLVAIAALYAFATGVTPTKKAPVATFIIEDHPDVVGVANANAFIVRHSGGDRINYNDLILAVYDSNKRLMYNKDVATANSTGDVKVDQLESPGYNDKYFEGGEQIIVPCDTVGITEAGTYEVVLYYKPTMQPLADKEVVIT